MPIHLSILHPRLAEGGKIKIGGLGKEHQKRDRQGTYRQPEKYDHFVLTKTIRSGEGDNFVIDDDLMKAIMDGDPSTTRNDGKGVRRLIRVPILLDSDVIDEVLPTRLAAYWGKRLWCSGTGEPGVPATRAVIENGQKVGTKGVGCPCHLLKEPEKGVQCKPNGTLWATVYAGANTTLGIRHSFRTTSWNSIRSMLASLQTIQRRIGTIVNVPLYLVLREERVRDRKDRVRKIYVAHIELQVMDLAALRQLQREALEAVQLRNQVSAIAGRPVRLGLPVPAATTEPRQEQARVGQEFYPAQQRPEPEEPDDDGGDDGVVEYDPETGEVFGDTEVQDAVDPPSPDQHDQRPEGERMSAWDADAPIDTTAKEHQGAGPDASKGTASTRERVPEDHPLRSSILKLLNEVAVDRDFAEADMKKGRAEIWAEACTAIGSKVDWKDVDFVVGYQLEKQLASMRRSED